ncbi:MAG TPA: cell division protein FtsB [Steroidobacteraceae bacterium]|nr:cell division protein FtsB [Steroidobacteraceae bacterium]
MKAVAITMLIMILGLQYRLWVSDDGMREVWRLRKEVTSQTEENAKLKERNRNLAAEVLDLKKGKAEIEERARADLGMVGANETFFEVAPVPSHKTTDSSSESSSNASVPATISSPGHALIPMQARGQ